MTVKPNPNPARITDASWWFMDQLVHNLAPGSQNGGIYANKRGHHNTRAANDANWPGDYSVRDPEDRGGPADKASAYDWTFPDAQRGDYRTISKFMKRIIASGKDSEDPRLDGWHDIYGQADSDGHVEGWDCRRLVDITSDSSHLWHIHMSEDRDKVADYENKRRMLSVLSGESLAEWRGQTSPPAPAPTPPVQPSQLPHFANGSRTLRLLDPQLRGTDVLWVQRFIGPARAGVADGIYGPGTTSGVRWYQGMRGLAVDGVVGPNTWRHLLQR